MFQISRINIHSQSGQTLIETVAAMAVAVIMVAALVGLGILALRTAMTAKKKAISTRFANQAMEAVRIYRDTGGYTQLPADGQCLIMGTDGSISSSELCGDFRQHPLNNDFQYKMEIDEIGGQCSGSCKIIKVTVQWSDAGGIHPVELETHLTDWK